MLDVPISVGSTPLESDPGQNTPHRTIDVHVGEQLKTKRMERGLSQDSLANSIHGTVERIEAYEQGQHRISASHLLAFTRALDVSLASLFAGF